MIVGRVELDEGIIRLNVIGSRGRKREIIVVVNTGYSGTLSLPSSMVAELNLKWQEIQRAKLADGSICTFSVYEAKVIWDGKVKSIFVDQSDSQSLAGTNSRCKSAPAAN